MSNNNNNKISNIKSIDKLLLNGSHEDIQQNLLTEIYKIATYCDTLIGEGYYGRVVLQSVGKEMTIKIDDELIKIPVVIKESKQSRISSKFKIDVVDSNLIIHCGEGMICEAIFLFLLSKLWYKQKNIHVPLLVGMGSCDDHNIGVSHLVLEKYGLPDRINIKKHKFFGSPGSLAFEEQYIINSFLTNVGGLIDYVCFNMNIDMTCRLPNGITIDITELIDNMCIFYLHTTHILWETYKLTLGDQSTNNIFVHWIDENSVCGKKKLGNLKYINYQIGEDKYIKINTKGIVFKIGDIGISVMNPQPSVMIVGTLSNPDNVEDVLKYKTKSQCYWDFIFDSIRYLPLEIVSRTIIYQIIQKYNISLKYIPFVGTNIQHINSMPSELDILNDKLYEKFFTNNVENNDENFTNFL